MNSFRHWIRMLREHGPIDLRNLDRALTSTLLSPITAPLRLAESAVYGRRIRSEKITKPPIFILGHWRTGTTYLHSLLTQDKNMGFVPLFQTLAPNSFLTGRKTLQPLVALRAPKTRPMDNVELGMNIAQEEEFAIANSSEQSFYLGWYFPKSMDALFRKYALFEDVSETERLQWKDTYVTILKAATFHSGGAQLVLKNPVNTARIELLLELFPDAKFVHISRDPYSVFKSTLRMHRAVLDLVAFQESEDSDIEDRVMRYYRELMTRYLDDRTLIPKDNLIEVTYEDLMTDPLSEVERVYDRFQLPHWGEARAHVAEFVLAQRTYRPNQFTMAQSDIEKVQEHWGFALDTWGYDPPAVESLAAAGLATDG